MPCEGEGARLAISNNQGGSLDEIQIFSRTLSTDEIKAIYDIGTLGECKP